MIAALGFQKPDITSVKGTWLLLSSVLECGALVYILKFLASYSIRSVAINHDCFKSKLKAKNCNGFHFRGLFL